MGRYKNWTEEEELYLQEHWGSKSAILISNHLQRPYGGVRRKAAEMGLLDPTLHYDGITVNQLTIALGISVSTTKSWIKKYNFPAKQKIFSKKQRIYVISYDDFWEWAEKHKHLINFTKLEPLILGKEPAWVKEKRSMDKNNARERRPWTERDKSRLIGMVSSYKYTYPEIASILKRPESAIKSKLIDLGIKARPLSLDKHIKYTTEEIRWIFNLLDEGYSLNSIADIINEHNPPHKHKSAGGIKGKLERMGFRFHKDLPVEYPEGYKENSEKAHP